MSSLETSEVESSSKSLTLIDDFGIIIHRVISDLADCSLVKDKDFSYHDLKTGFLTMVVNCWEYSIEGLRDIRDAGGQALMKFPNIEVEKDAFEFVEGLKVQYSRTLYELCKDLLKGEEDPYTATDLIYESIHKNELHIKKHFEDLSNDLKITLDYGSCIKLKETAKQKIEREAVRSSSKACFGKLKDLIRCRCTVYSLAELETIFDHFQDNFDILQVKNGLDRKNVPTVYIVYKMQAQNTLPPVEFQILYKERNHKIHDFYDLARLNNHEEFEAWALYNSSKMFPTEYPTIHHKIKGEKFTQKQNNVVNNKKTEKSVASKISINNIAYDGPPTDNWALKWTGESLDAGLESLKFDYSFQDQGFGNQKGQVELKLCSHKLGQYPDCGEWGPVSERKFENVLAIWTSDYAPHQNTSFSQQFTANDEIISSTSPGCFYELWTKAGGGGGHQLNVNNISIEYKTD